jgi:hypothetical protein
MRPSQIGICFSMILLLAISGCRKDKALGKLVYDIPYTISGTKGEDKVRVFTRSGEILAPGLLSYYKAKEIDQLNDYVNMMVAGRQGIDTLRFTTDQEAAAYEAYNRRTYRVSNGKNRLELNTKDTLIGYFNVDQYSKSILYNMCLLKPLVYQEYLYSSTPQYIFGYKAIEKLIVIPQNEELEIPLLTFVWYGNSTLNKDRYFYNKFNSLDPQFYKNMVSGDTVVLKETTILYRQ